MMEFDLKQLVLAQNELLMEILRRLDRLEKEPQIIRQYIGGGLSKTFADASYLLLNGSNKMTGDLDMDGHNIGWVTSFGMMPNGSFIGGANTLFNLQNSIFKIPFPPQTESGCFWIDTATVQLRFRLGLNTYKWTNDGIV